MKLSYFRLVARPFPSTPDPQFYYAATSHEAALESLRQALDDEEGLCLLTGEPGMGKTLVARMLLERTGDEVNSALITNCRFAQRADLLRAVLFDLGQPFQGLAEQELRLALTSFLIDEYSQGRRTVLVFDEAQDLSSDLLQEIRLLGNIEAGRGKAVQVVLASLPDILERLNSPELAIFHQRLAVRSHLDALDLHESADYLLHHLRQAGAAAERLMTDEALSLLAKNAHGIPRLLNRYAHHALALAERVRAPQVDVEVVLEALAALGVDAEPAEDDFPTRPTLAAEAPADDDRWSVAQRSRSPLPAQPTIPAAPPTPRSPLGVIDPPWIAGAFGSATHRE